MIFQDLKTGVCGLAFQAPKIMQLMVEAQFLVGRGPYLEFGLNWTMWTLFPIPPGPVFLRKCIFAAIHKKDLKANTAEQVPLLHRLPK